MGSPNINQKLYLAKALNENTEGMFDHEEINEALPGTNKAKISGAEALKNKVDTKPNPNKVKMMKNPKWEGPGRGNQPQFIPVKEDHDEICEILAEMLNDVLDEAAPKQHSPRNQAAIDAMKKRGQKEKKRRYADAEAAIRAGNAKPTHVTDGGRVSYWRKAHR